MANMSFSWDMIVFFLRVIFRSGVVGDLPSVILKSGIGKSTPQNSNLR